MTVRQPSDVGPPPCLPEFLDGFHTDQQIMDRFEQELKAKLQSAEGDETIIRWISEKVLESYRGSAKDV